MASNKNQLKTNIIAIMQDMMTREETSIEEFAERLADAVDDYVKEAEVMYINGLIAPNGAVTGTFNGNLR